MMKMLSRALVFACLVLLASPAAGQAPDGEPRPFRPLRIAKWGTLLGAASGAIYGFVQNHRADERFNDLEQQCQDQPVRCSLRTPSGAYQDAEFETLYHDVRSLDRRAHNALLLSQIGVAASVVLFLLDLDNTRRPPDIPFVPAARLSVRSNGAATLTFSVPTR